MAVVRSLIYLTPGLCARVSRQIYHMLCADRHEKWRDGGGYVGVKGGRLQTVNCLMNLHNLLHYFHQFLHVYLLGLLEKKRKSNKDIPRFWFLSIFLHKCQFSWLLTVCTIQEKLKGIFCLKMECSQVNMYLILV